MNTKIISHLDAIEAKHIFETLEKHFTQWAKDTGAKHFVVGLSGGKDSTVVGLILCDLFGAENVTGVLLPQHEQKDISDSRTVAAILGVNTVTINVGEACDSITTQIFENRKTSGIYVSPDCDINIPARIRMSTLFAVGQCVNGRVINTSNLSEDVVGYATQFGDNAGCYAPIQGLTVTEVRILGRFLLDRLAHRNNLTSLDVEKMLGLIAKTPVDGLQPKSDEEKLGFTYEALDSLIRKNEGSDEFKALIAAKYKANKFKTEIVVMPQPDYKLPNYVAGTNLPEQCPSIL